MLPPDVPPLDLLAPSAPHPIRLRAANPRVTAGRRRALTLALAIVLVGAAAGLSGFLWAHSAPVPVLRPTLQPDWVPAPRFGERSFAAREVGR